MSPKLSLIAPIFNEELVVEEFYKQAKNNLVALTENYEIIFIDDGSSDNTWSKIRRIAESDKKIIALRFSRNFGHHFAITAGLQKATGEYAIVMDTDLQDDPKVIKNLYDEINKGYDVVFVNRIKRTDKLMYKILQRLFYIILNSLSGLKFDHRQANFSMISRKVIDAFNLFPESSRFYISTVHWLGFKTTSIDAQHQKRFDGKPSYSFKKRFALASDIIISFSERPLKIGIYFGVFSSGMAFIASAYIIICKILWGFEIQGWTSIMTTITFFSGLLLIVIGIMGIYLGRIFKEVKKRPLYILSEAINLT
jgi:glycosyltransferase involved in cell wall biosynthesis